MVNASLNWASIVGIVLAVGGALLYFMRNFKPALARDYDVFFAAVGLLCGGILIFQGWRLDPILQFGQFLLAGTTVFFAYESVRLRSVTTEQARRSSYFDDDDEPPVRPRMGGGREYGDDLDRFDEPQPLSRRIPSRPDDSRDDFYRQSRQPARAAIPERAASRRGDDERWDRPEDRDGSAGYGRSTSERSETDRFSGNRGPSRFRAGGAAGPKTDTESFGARRRERDSGLESRRGSRPTAAAEGMPRSNRRPGTPSPQSPSPAADAAASERRPGIPEGRPLRPTGDGAPRGRSDVSDADFSPVETPPSTRAGTTAKGSSPSAPGAAPSPRDNSSRFDD